MIKEKLPNKFIISGHRGYAAKYPENTLLSFKAAIELGVDMIEFDLRLSADGVLMVMHDANLDRTTNGTGPLNAKTRDELKELDAGIKKGKCFEGLKIPTFTELLEFVEPYKNLLFSVEIKTAEDDIACLDAAVKLTDEYGITDRCVFTSFDAAVTDRVHDLYGLPNLGYHEKYMTNLKPDSISKLWSVGVPMKDVNEEHIKYWRNLGIFPCTFCADTEDQYMLSLQSGAAMVTCNDPVPALTLSAGKKS